MGLYILFKSVVIPIVWDNNRVQTNGLPNMIDSEYYFLT